MASTKAASAAKSRAAVASIELSAAASSRVLSAIAAGSSPSDDPANAPDPYGDTAARLSQSASRSTCAPAARMRQQMMGQQDRLRGLHVRLAGHDRRRMAAAWVASAPMTSSTPSAILRTASRSHSRNSVATWSFRTGPPAGVPRAPPRHGR